MGRKAINATAMGLVVMLSGCSELVSQGCDADEAAEVIASNTIEQVASNPFGGLVTSLADAFLPLAAQGDPDANFNDFIQASEFEFRDVVVLKQGSSTAVCSGALYYKQDDRWLTIGAEFTWRVDPTEDGSNYYQWFEGRQNASAFD